MNRDDVLRMAREAGMNATVGKTSNGKYHPNVSAIAKSIPVEWLERFAALVTAEATAARIAAQTENEALKAKIAASGVAERRAVREAVLAEREACAALVASWNTAITDKLAADIRARWAA